MNKILVIQTAFIGDVILATALLETIHLSAPEVSIDLLVRTGNETLFANHPYINKVLVWNKKENKLKNLVSIVAQIRNNKYDVVINLQRFLSSGIFTVLSSAKTTIGFDKNPLSILFTYKVKHEIGDGRHEIERNHELTKVLYNFEINKPKLYPTSSDIEAIKNYQNSPYYCIAPNSVWFTKQLPAQKWVELINILPTDKTIYLIGAPNDHQNCEKIKNECLDYKIVNLAGKLSFLKSAALMSGAIMNFVNDSAPMHLASAVNAPVTAVFCSTVPTFGFGPLSDNSKVVETKEILSCRPCGLHGFRSCPQEHFKCANTIQVETILG